MAVIGALLGFTASLLFSPGYQSASRVLLQGSRDPDELLTEAQIAVSSVVLERAAATLRWNVPVEELQDVVTAEVVDGNVIEIRGTDADPERARRLTDQVANEFVTYSSQLISNPANSTAQLVQEQQKSLQLQVKTANQKISDMHRDVRSGALTVEEVAARTELENLRTALTAASKELDEAEAATTKANVVVIEPAVLPTQQAAPTVTQLTGGGALAGFLLGIAGHLIAVRTDRRLRGGEQIGEALGTKVLGRITVAEEPPPVSRWARLLGADRPWQTPETEIGAVANRYRRILGKLRGGQGVPLRLLVLVADDDPEARAVALQLVTAAAGDGHAAVNGNGHTATDPTLRIAVITANRPAVAEDPAMSGALVVVSSGRRTGWELVGVAEACTDSGHRVVGALIAQPARTRAAQQSTQPAPADQDEAFAGKS